MAKRIRRKPFSMEQLLQSMTWTQSLTSAASELQPTMIESQIPNEGIGEMMSKIEELHRGFMQVAKLIAWAEERHARRLAAIKAMGASAADGRWRRYGLTELEAAARAVRDVSGLLPGVIVQVTPPTPKARPGPSPWTEEETIGLAVEYEEWAAKTGGSQVVFCALKGHSQSRLTRARKLVRTIQAKEDGTAHYFEES